MRKFFQLAALAIMLLIGGSAFAQQTATQALTLTVQAAPLSIVTASLPYGITTTAYSQTIVASGGVAPLTFSVSTGALPAGLTLNAATGVISGTPTTISSNSFTIKVSDSESTPLTATQTYSVPIVGKLTITTTILPTAIIGQPYNGIVTFVGGVAPYTCSVSIGSLPAWATLAVAGQTCTITGTPTAVVADSFTLQVGSTQ